MTDRVSVPRPTPVWQPERVALLLSHLGEDAAAARVDAAVIDHLATRGEAKLSTAEVGKRIRERL